MLLVPESMTIGFSAKKLSFRGWPFTNILDGESDQVSRLFFDFTIGAHKRSEPCSLVSLMPPRVSSALPM